MKYLNNNNNVTGTIQNKIKPTYTSMENFNLLNKRYSENIDNYKSNNLHNNNNQYSNNNDNYKKE